MAREVTTELLDAIQDGFNRHDVEAILSHFVENCEWVMARGPNAPEGRRCRGKQRGQARRTSHKNSPMLLRVTPSLSSSALLRAYHRVP